MPTASWLGNVKSAAIVLLVMLFSSATAWADDSGSCGDNLKWEFTSSDSTLTISGTGEMKDYGPEERPWRHYIYKINKIILPEGLSKIGTWAFYDVVNLKEITIPASVTQINQGAFKHAGSQVPDGCILTFAKGSKLNTIGTDVFCCFKGNIDLHECTNLTTIDMYAFQSTVYLEKLTIPASVETIRDRAFWNVGSELDNGCTLTFAQGSKLSSIGEKAFKDFKGNIDLHECTSLTTIGQYAFSGGVNLEKLTIPASVETIEENAFENVGSKLSNGCTLTVAQGSKLSSIGSNAFKAFKGTIDLQECTSLTTIEKQAFYNVVNLKELTIPASVETIAENAFENVGSKLSNGCTLTFAQGSKLSSIGSYAFKAFKGTIDLHECTSLTTINQNIFSGVVNLKEISIPASIETIADNAFENVGSELSNGCTLTVAKGSKLKSIKSYAFKGFKGDIDMYNCKNLTTINSNVFENYQNGTIKLPVSLKTINANAFINSSPTKVFVAYKNCVFYVSGTYKDAHTGTGTGFRGWNIRSALNIGKNSSKKLYFYRVSFDEISMSFDANDKTYVISNEQGLIDLGMKMCTEEVTKSCKKLKFKLAADLDFTNMPSAYQDKEETGKGNFMPIGKMGKEFSYPFDGQGHTIKGLKYDGGSDIGLFYKVSSSGSVKNLTLITPSFSGYARIGGIAGYNSGGTITGCTVIAPSISGKPSLGGIVGYNSGGTIENCNVIKPSISGIDSYIGCIVGRNSDSKTIKKCLYDISTGLYIEGYKSSAPESYSTANGNKPVLHLNLGYGITSNDAITVSNYTMAELYDRVRLDAYRAGYDLVDYKSEEVTVNDGLFEMPKKNVSVTAVWEPMTEIILKGSLIEGLNWTTFYCGDAGYQINKDVNACAYTATVGDDVITLHLLGKMIPKGTAVIIVSEDIEINMTRDDVSAAEYKIKNDLRGVDMPTLRTSLTSNDTKTLYMLSNKNNNFGFHSFGATNVPARKAYFTISSAVKARAFSMVFEDEATAFKQLRITNDELPVYDSSIYDLNGRKVNGQNLKPGIYVKNGKKVVIK